MKYLKKFFLVTTLLLFVSINFLYPIDATVAPNPTDTFAIGDLVYKLDSNQFAHVATNNVDIEKVVIPATVEYDLDNNGTKEVYKVQSVAPKGFQACTKLNSVTFPITSDFYALENNAFQGCTSLLTLSFPDNITYFGDYAFSGCSKLKDIGGIPPKLDTMGVMCFDGCLELATPLVFPSTFVNGLNGQAFQNCNKLRSVEFKGNIKIIGQNAFGLCFNLEKVIIPDSVTIIYPNAFRSCRSLKEIRLPKGMADGVYDATKNETTIHFTGQDYSFNNGGLKVVYTPWFTLDANKKTSIDATYYQNCETVMFVAYSDLVVPEAKRIMTGERENIYNFAMDYCKQKGGNKLMVGYTGYDKPRGNLDFGDITQFISTNSNQNKDAISLMRGETRTLTTQILSNYDFVRKDMVWSLTGNSDPTTSIEANGTESNVIKLGKNEKGPLKVVATSQFDNSKTVTFDIKVTQASMLFDSNGGSKVAEINDIVYGTTVSQPTAPIKADFVFEGWFKDSTFIDKWDFNLDTVVGNTTVYAKWTTKDDSNSKNGNKPDENNKNDIEKKVNQSVNKTKNTVNTADVHNNLPFISLVVLSGVEMLLCYKKIKE